MKIETKFGIGQEVWVKDPAAVESREQNKCPTCEGTGKLTGKDEVSYNCPRCHGMKVIEKIKHLYRPMRRVISRVIVSEESGVMCQDDLIPKKGVSLAYVMRKKAGDGSYRSSLDGKTYYEHEIFPTKSACQKAIEGEGAKI